MAQKVTKKRAESMLRYWQKQVDSFADAEPQPEPEPQQEEPKPQPQQEPHPEPEPTQEEFDFEPNKPDGSMEVSLCPWCGAKIRKGENTCHRCGNAVAWPELAEDPEWMVCEKCGWATQEKDVNVCPRCGNGA